MKVYYNVEKWKEKSCRKYVHHNDPRSALCNASFFDRFKDKKNVVLRQPRKEMTRFFQVVCAFQQTDASLVALFAPFWVLSLTRMRH